MVSIEPGKTDTVTFNVNRDAVGDFELAVKERKATLKVLETKSYTSPDYHYSVSYPLGWILNTEEPESITLEFNNTIFANIQSLILPVVMSQKYFTDQIISYSTKQLPQFKVVSSDTIQQYGDISGTRLDYTYSRFGVFVKGNCVILKQGRFGYLIDCVTQTSTWDNNKQLIDAFISSFVPPKIITGVYSDLNNGYSIALPFNWDAIASGKPGTLLTISKRN